VIEGLLVLPEAKTEQPFYGYKCLNCEDNNIKGYCYSCATCEERKVWCNKAECTEKQQDCIEKGHSIVLERSPCRFWAEKISEEELKIYNEAKIKKSLEIYKNAQKHYNKGDFCAARELYNEFLTENLKTDLVLNAKAYKKLASIAKKDSNKLPEVIENHLKALEINEKLHGFLHKSVRGSYLDLSEAYIKLQDYQNAFIYCEKKASISFKLASRRKAKISQRFIIIMDWSV